MSMLRVFHRRRLACLSMAGVLTAALSACGLASGSASEELDTVVVASSDFTEHALLGEIYAQAIEAKGVKVERRLNVGAREAYMSAIQGDNPSINVLPEYLGLLLEYYQDQPSAVGLDAVRASVEDVLPKPLAILESSSAADEDAFVTTSETAQKYGLETLEDLAPVADQLVMGASAPSETRRAGLVGLRDEYGVEFKDFATLDAAGPLSLKALLSDKVQISIFYTTQSAVLENDLVVLEDTKGITALGNVTPLIRSDVPHREDVEAALNAVSEALTTEELTRMLKRVDVDKEPLETVAEEFLAEQGLA